MDNAKRARAIKYNMLSGWALELFTLISGLILPRLILTAFGSEANGLTSSISQYMGFTVVLRAGLGGVTRAALYKPLADKNVEEVSSIMVATQSYMRKVALIIAGYIFAIAMLFPLIAKTEYSWDYVLTAVLIIGSTSFADNFFGIKAKILLQADQKYYVQTICALISSIVGFLASLVLIKVGAGLLVVKAGAAFGSFVSPLLLNLYIRKRYQLNMKAKPNNLAISQRWHAFAQQMAVVINENVDLVLLSAFVPLKEISVYTVHNMVVLNIKKIVEACVTGINSTFGDMMARGEEENLRSSFRFIEWLFFGISALIFSVTAVMLTPFIRLYTDSVTDVNYIRPLFAFVMTLVAFMSCLRLPYQMAVEAAGHFKQTKNGAILEVIVNIVVSVVMLKIFGIIGVLIGTFVAAMIRTLQYAIYAYKNILKISPWGLLRTYGVYMLSFLAIVGASLFFSFISKGGWLLWVRDSVIMVLFAVVVILIVSFINDRKQLSAVISILKSKIGRK